MSGVPRIELDRDVCVGSSSCVHIATGAFSLARDGKVELRDPIRATTEELEEAAESCPVSAIVVQTSTTTGERYQ